jgi:hypothetical protein
VNALAPLTSNGSFRQTTPNGQGPIHSPAGPGGHQFPEAAPGRALPEPAVRNDWVGWEADKGLSVVNQRRDADGRAGFCA